VDWCSCFFGYLGGLEAPAVAFSSCSCLGTSNNLWRGDVIPYDTPVVGRKASVSNTQERPAAVGRVASQRVNKLNRKCDRKGMGKLM
jgi:hypothetical protein